MSQSRAVQADRERRPRVEREPVLGELDRGRGHVGERPRAPALERGQPRVGRTGDDRVSRPLGQHVAVPCPDRLERRLAPPRPEAGHAPHLVAAGRAHEDRRDAAEVAHVRLHDVEHQPAGDARVDRVAAAVEHARRRLGGEVVPGRDGVARADDRGPIRLRRRQYLGAGLLDTARYHRLTSASR